MSRCKGNFHPHCVEGRCACCINWEEYHFSMCRCCGFQFEVSE